MSNAVPYGPPNAPEGENPSTTESVTGVSFIPAGLSFDEKTESSLNDLVSQFKEGKISMARAISQIGQELFVSVTDPEKAKAADSALESFIAILLSHKKSLERAAQRGSSDRSGQGPDNDNERRAGPSDSDPDDDGSDLRKRDRSPDAEPPTSNQLAGASNKKRRIYEVDQPWYLRDFIAQSVLSPSEPWW